MAERMTVSDRRELGRITLLNFLMGGFCCVENEKEEMGPTAAAMPDCTVLCMFRSMRRTTRDKRCRRTTVVMCCYIIHSHRRRQPTRTEPTNIGRVGKALTQCGACSNSE